MSKYQKKYKKYKTKYISLKESLSPEEKNLLGVHGINTNKINKRKLGKLLGRQIQINTIKIKDLIIPKELLNGSYLDKAYKSMGDVEKTFDSNIEKFKPENALLELNQDDLSEGRFKFVTHKGENYYVKGIPFLYIDNVKKTLCFSWITSFFMNLPYVEKLIIELKEKYKRLFSLTDDGQYLNFDCVTDFMGDVRGNSPMLTDIIILIRYIVDGIGFFEISTRSSNDNITNSEFIMITSIIKADEPEVIG